MLPDAVMEPKPEAEAEPEAEPAELLSAAPVGDPGEVL
jgi:hypothetical protein